MIRSRLQVLPDEELLEPPPQAEMPTASASAATNIASAISGFVLLNLTYASLCVLNGRAIIGPATAGPWK